MKKILKNIITASFVVFACMFLYACNPDTTVSKSQWNAAFGYQSKFSVVVTDSKLPELTTKIYIQEKLFKVEETVNNVTKTSYYVENGETYWKYTYSQELLYWNVEPIEETEYKLAIQLPALEDVSYDNFWFIYAKNYYKATDIKINNVQVENITVKFYKTQLSEIAITDSAKTLTYQFDFKTDFTLSLPGQGTQPGQINQVNETEWKAAFDIQGDFSKTSNGVVTLARDGYKYKSDADSVVYYDYDGQKYWQYSFDDMFTKEWMKVEIDKDTYDTLTSLLLMPQLKYSDFAYNEQTDEYIASNITVTQGFVNVTYQEIIIKFNNKKIDRVSCTMFGMTVTEYYSYNDVTIYLPVPGEGTGENNGPLTQQEWDTALNFSNQNVAIIYDNGSVYRDGNKTKMTDENGNYYFEFDGQNYYTYMQFVNDPQVIKVTIDQATYEENLAQFDYSKMFTFNSFTYDSVNDVYKAENLTYPDGVFSLVTIKFDNKKVVSIVTNDGISGQVSAAISYDPAVYTVTIPTGEAGGETNGEVSFVEWYSAFAIQGDFSVTVDGIVTVCRDGNKYKAVNEMETKYYDFDGENYWQYTYDGLNQKWVRTEQNQSTYQALTSWLTISNLDYSDFTYDQQNDWYVATNVDVTSGLSTTTYDQMIIKFQNKQISYIKTTILGYSTTQYYSYEDATVTLPEIEGVELTAQQWTAAFDFSTQNIKLTGVFDNETSYVIKDGNKMLITAYEDEKHYYDFDGTNYYFYKQIGAQKAVRSKIAKAEYDYIKNDFNFNVFFTFSMFEYDQANDEYVALNYTLGDTTYDKVTIKFVNKQVNQIILTTSNDQEMVYVSYNQSDYQITLPEYEDDQCQVTEAEWLDALNLSTKSVYMHYNFDTHMFTRYIAKDGNKMKWTEEGIDYYMNFDGTDYYMYFVEEGFPPMSFPIPEEEYLYMLDSLNLTNSFAYSLFTYDPIENIYVASDIQDGEFMYSYIVLKFENKKLVQLTTVDQIDGKVICSYDYREESYKITLPISEPLEGAEQVSAEEWNLAFAYTNKMKIDMSVMGYVIQTVIIDGDNIKTDSMGEVKYYTHSSGGYYVYEANGESGYSRNTCTNEEYLEQNFLAIFGQMVSQGDFEWDETSKSYYLQYMEVEGVIFIDINITFVENKVAKITMTNYDGSVGTPIELTVDYSENYTVVLPA